MLLIERQPRIFVSKLASGKLEIALHRWNPLEEEARLHYFLIEQINANPLP